MRSVNLTPPDKKKLAGEKKKAEGGRKLGPMHMAGLGILVAAAALGYYSHGVKGQAAEKTQQADALEAEVQTLNTQITALQNASSSSASTPSSYETDRQLVSGLAAARVNWSNVTTNLARIAPDGVWLKSLDVTTPTGDQAAASSGGSTVQRPASITVEGESTSRTAAALFISRLSAIPGFDQPRLNGGIDPQSGEGDSSGDSSGPETYAFTIEIPVDDQIFGSVRPVVPGGSTGASSSTTTPAQP